MKKMVKILLVGIIISGLSGFANLANAEANDNIKAASIQGNSRNLTIEWPPGFPVSDGKPKFVRIQVKIYGGVLPVMQRYSEGGKSGYLTRESFIEGPDMFSWYVTYSGYIR